MRFILLSSCRNSGWLSLVSSSGCPERTICTNLCSWLSRSDRSSRSSIARCSRFCESLTINTTPPSLASCCVAKVFSRSTISADERGSSGFVSPKSMRAIASIRSNDISESTMLITLIPSTNRSNAASNNVLLPTPCSPTRTISLKRSRIP